MAFDNRMADGKANSQTTLFGREHRVENMIVVGWIDTRASILDDHVNKIWFANAGSYAQYSRRYRLHRWPESLSVAEPLGELPWRQAGAQAHIAQRESTSERPRPIFFPHNSCPPGPSVQRCNKISVALALVVLALSACTSERQAPWRAEQPTTPQPPPPTTPPPAKK
jgi:hypothetical protein